MQHLIEPISNMVVKYDVTNAAIEELSKRYAPLKITDTKSYKVVLAAINDVRGYRIATENKRKELKKGALEYGRKVDSEAKRIAALLEPIETELRNKKQVVDDKKAAIIAEKVRVEEARIAVNRDSISQIQQLTIGLNGLDVENLENLLMQMDDEMLVLDDYDEFKEEAAAAIANTSAIIKQAILARKKLDDEVEAQRIENIRLEEIRVAQEAEAKRLEAETARMDAAREAEKARIAEAQAKIDAENRKVVEARRIFEVEKQAETARKEREVLEKRLAKEAAIKAEKDAKEKSQREEAERVARKEAEAKEAARQEALKPDKEKLQDLASTLIAMVSVEFETQVAKKLADETLSEIHGIGQDLFIRIAEI